MSAIGLLVVAALLVFAVIVVALIWAAPIGREDRTGFSLDSAETPAVSSAASEAKETKGCVVPVVAKT